MATPSRLVLCVGGVLGLLMIVLAPGWFAGADEGTHLVRSVAMANGQFLPERLDGSLRSTVPAAHSESIGAVIRASATHDAPNSGELLGRLLDIRPDWNDTVRFDTGSTMASSPVAYAPSALFMVLPNALDAPPIVTLWFGRLGDLLVYLALAVLAVRTAVAFRWTLAIAAVVPMNLAMAASVSEEPPQAARLTAIVWCSARPSSPASRSAATSSRRWRWP